MKHTVIFFLFLAGSLQGKLPELDAIFYGTVSHKISSSPTELIAGSDTIVVEAELNGVVIARAVMDSGSSQYALKVPIDDGVDPRLLGTARRGERVRIYARNLSRPELEGEAIESTNTSGLSLPEEKGLIRNQNLTFAEDLGGSLVVLAFMRWAEGQELVSENVDELALHDPDGDGNNNLDEFLAGTDPNSSLSFFTVMDVVRFNQNSFLQFGPIIPERSYTIYRSPDLSDGSWLKAGTVTPGIEAAHFWFQDSGATPKKDGQFYRVGIEVEQ